PTETSHSKMDTNLVAIPPIGSKSNLFLATLLLSSCALVSAEVPRNRDLDFHLPDLTESSKQSLPGSIRPNDPNANSTLDLNRTIEWSKVEETFRKYLSDDEVLQKWELME